MNRAKICHRNNFKWTIFYYFLFLNIYSNILFGGENSLPKDFIVSSIPKSGTHLVTKLLTLMTGREGFSFYLDNNLPYGQFESILNNAKNDNKFIYNHSEILPFMRAFCKKNPNCVGIIVVRDLRDVMISMVFYAKTYIQEEMGYKASESEILTYLLNGKGNLPLWLHLKIKEIVNYLPKENICLLRFENLIDSLSGGSNEVQNWHITNLASVLNIPLMDIGIDYICNNLLGNKAGTPVSHTFNVGKMGRWKTFFSEEQLQIFEKKLGYYQTALGYPIRVDFIPSIP